MSIRLKFCGMRRPQDAALASSLGADAVGMIFYEKSARYTSISQAQEIIAELNPLCSPVAVVVNPQVSFMQNLLAQLDIQLIQFHGDESSTFCEQFKLPYTKAVRMKEGTRLSEIRKQYAKARGLLLDTYDKNLIGGTGRAFDWDMLDAAKNDLRGPELILAGGLGPENVADAIAQTGIRTIDVNSGIETAPGIKDHNKMREIVRLLNAL
jgi:phosphoribosylanthranilate isomerase